MNGYTESIPLVTRLYNIIEQIPQEYRARAIEECRASAAAEIENANDYDTERHLIAYVAARKWELYPSPIDEAEIFTDGFCDERLDNPFELKMHSLTIDFSGAVENATRRSAELKAGIDARMAEAKERNKGQYSPLK
jgi:hypothetical protein